MTTTPTTLVWHAEHSLTLSWSTSRAADSYGWNMVRMDDNTKDKRFRTTGGGYDLIGTVFGGWLEANYQQRLLHAHVGKLYGASLSHVAHMRRINLDGGCGLESMINIATAIGLDVERTFNRRGLHIGFIVRDTVAPALA